MPNWCSNSLTVVGETEQEVQDFLEKCKREDKEEDNENRIFSFSALVPMPVEEENNWYNWNINNWGTKWDACEPNISLEGDTAYVSFETAWSPPVEWLARVAPLFPNLSFELTYHEPGMAFAGKTICTGEGFSDACYSSGDEGYFDIITEGMTDGEMEERAWENIENNALDGWDYEKELFIKYIGEEHRQKIEDLIVANKVLGNMPQSTDEKLYGDEVEDIVKQTIGEEQFYENILNHHKENKTLKKLAY